MSANVRTYYDDEPVTGVLLSAPNAISVCKVQLRDVVVTRHVSKIEPLGDEARRMMRSGDSYARRDAPEVIQKIAVNPDVPTSSLDGWTLEQLDSLRLFLVDQYQELQTVIPRAQGKGKGKLIGQWQRCASVLRHVNKRLKDARRTVEIAKSGLSAGQSRDPSALLARAAELLWRMHKAGMMTDEEKSVIHVIQDYLVNVAAVSE